MIHIQQGTLQGKRIRKLLDAINVPYVFASEVPFDLECRKLTRDYVRNITKQLVGKATLESHDFCTILNQNRADLVQRLYQLPKLSDEELQKVISRSSDAADATGFTQFLLANHIVTREDDSYSLDVNLYLKHRTSLQEEYRSQMQGQDVEGELVQVDVNYKQLLLACCTMDIAQCFNKLCDEQKTAEKEIPGMAGKEIPSMLSRVDYRLLNASGLKTAISKLSNLAYEMPGVEAGDITQSANDYLCDCLSMLHRQQVLHPKTFNDFEDEKVGTMIEKISGLTRPAHADGIAVDWLKDIVEEGIVHSAFKTFLEEQGLFNTETRHLDVPRYLQYSDVLKSSFHDSLEGKRCNAEEAIEDFDTLMQLGTLYDTVMDVRHAITDRLDEKVEAAGKGGGRGSF